MPTLRPRPLVRPIVERADLPPALSTKEGLGRLLQLFASGPVVVITGAGISTDSGIPDYRGPSGRARNATPMSYQDFVSGHEMQQRYWARSFAGWPVMGLAEPNEGHRALAGLTAQGRVSGVITQNVDRLHARVGTEPLIELHGSLDRVVCLACGDVSSRETLQDRLAHANPELDPRRLSLGDDSGEVKPDGDIDVVEAAVRRFNLVPCLRCGHGPLKPDVVFFGESVPRDRILRAAQWVEQASGVLVVGSSLAVMSAYQFVRQAERLGRAVAIVNQGPTRGDGEAHLRVNAPVGPLLSELETRLAEA